MTKLTDINISQPNLPDITELTTFKGQLTDEAEYIDQLFNKTQFTTPNKHLKFEYCLFQEIEASENIQKWLNLTDCRIDQSNLANANWNESTWNCVEVNNSRLTGLKLNEVVFQDVVFADCRADYLQFQSVKCKRVKFSHCDLSNSYFQGANLSGVIFDQCNLSDTDFSEVILTGADLRGSNVEGLKIDSKNLRGVTVDINQAIYFAQLMGLKIL